jgi:beta-glucanase (GH16 family)
VAALFAVSSLVPGTGADAGVDSDRCRVVVPSAEHRNLSGSSAQVERLYRALFLRRPEPAGLEYWVKVLDAGRADLVEVAELFATSAEFRDRYGRLSDDEFVDLLYCNVLGRTNQDPGRHYWRDQLRGGLGRAETVLYFSQSPEFGQRSVGASDGPTVDDAPDELAAVAPETESVSTTSTTPTTASTRAEEVEPPPPTRAPATTTAATTTAGPTTTVVGSTTVTGGNADDRLQLVWHDEFDRLDTSRWRPEHSTYGDGNNELQCYRPENVLVLDGALVLRARKETYTCPNGSKRSVTSGMVRGSIRFEYGQRIEYRVKVEPADPDDQRGLWPALWASSWNGGGWPAGGEFDWLEYVGTTPTRSNHAIHWQDTGGRHRHNSKPNELGERFSDRWHVIGFDWSDDLVWYLDGQEVHRVDPDTLDVANDPFAPDARPVTQVKLNLALGGNWPGPLGPTTVDEAGTTGFLVDYVRIYDLG